MNKSERIRLIQRCREALDNMSSDDEDLVLDTFGIGARPEDSFGNDGPSVTQWLNGNASDADLIALGQHLEVLENEPAASPQSSTAEPEPLFLFASHLATHRGFLGEVEEALKTYQVRMFVAHDSIPMDADWAREIVDALNVCHGGVAFLHANFHDSYYCQQECGWMLGRGIPVARLILGESPRGLLGDLQGRELRGQGAAAVAETIIDWATSKAPLSGHVAASLSLALQHSGSFNNSDRVWARLRDLNEVTSEQLRRIIFAAEYNGQVYRANVGGWNGTAYRTAIATKATEWDTEGTFTGRIAQLRKKDGSSAILPPEDELRDYAGLLAADT